VEQNNGSVVREYIGYDRLEGNVPQERLAAVYRDLVPLLTFFMPTAKLESKIKTDSKEIKKYDAPRCPYQQLMESDARSSEVKAQLSRLYGLYNPVRLQHHVSKAVLALRDAVAAQLPSGSEPAA
jgi:hypothetical protein